MTTKDIRIIKIGGSVLKGPKSFMPIAAKISKRFKKRICVITSAMGGKTDELMQTFRTAVPGNDFWNSERFVGLGEIQAAILLESAFRVLKKDSIAVLPWMKEWPLYISLKNRPEFPGEKADERRNFSVLKKSNGKVKTYLKPMLKEKDVVIIPGFIAKDGRGRMVTLGRGGSDISALLISELLDAGELTLIKDVKGVMSADPRFHKKSRSIRILDADEFGIIASSGAKIVNPISLQHREKIKKIRVVSATSENLDTGTEIFFDRGITVIPSNRIYSVLTFIGQKIPETPGILFEISKLLAQNKISIHSITISDNLVAVYVDDKKSNIAYQILTPLLEKIENLKVLNLKRKIGKVVVRSLKFINEPGIIKKIVTPVAGAGINIWEILTVHTDVMVFVERTDLEKAARFIKGLFNREKR